MRPIRDNKNIFFGGLDSDEEEGNGFEGKNKGLESGPAYGVRQDESIEFAAPGDLPIRTSLDEPIVPLEEEGIVGPDEASLQTAF